MKQSANAVSQKANSIRVLKGLVDLILKPPQYFGLVTVQIVIVGRLNNRIEKRVKRPVI